MKNKFLSNKEYGRIQFEKKETLMTKCDRKGCTSELSKFDVSLSRKDAILIQVLSTGKLYWFCNECAKEMGLKS